VLPEYLIMCSTEKERHTGLGGKYLWPLLAKGVSECAQANSELQVKQVKNLKFWSILWISPV